MCGGESACKKDERRARNKFFCSAEGAREEDEGEAEGESGHEY